MIIFFHGLDAHSNYYKNFATNFSKNGYEVLAFDYIGFGKSEGLRGYIPSPENHLADSRNFIKKVQSLYANKYPIFLIGANIGGQSAY